LFKILETVSNDFGISANQLLLLMQEKREANSDFHLNWEIKKYAQSQSTTGIYDINEFLGTQNLHLLDEKVVPTFQPVFEKTCTIINTPNTDQQQNEITFQKKDNVLVLFDDLKFYEGKLIGYNYNKWHVKFKDTEHGKQWIPNNRLFPL